MPTKAQDGVSRGPIAALLILLSLLLGSATAAAGGTDPGGPSTRLGSGRQAAAAALLPAGPRNPLDEEVQRSGTGPCVLPSAPGLVAGRLRMSPAAGFPSAPSAAAPRPAGLSYRARAPPALRSAAPRGPSEPNLPLRQTHRAGEQSCHPRLID